MNPGGRLPVQDGYQQINGLSVESEVYDGESIILEGGEEFPEGSTVHIDEHGNAHVYSPEEEIDLNNIAEQVEITNSRKTWSVPLENEDKPVKAGGRPPVVLMTNESLRVKPQLYVSSGKPRLSRNDQAAQWERASDNLPSTSQLPPMMPVFRLYGTACVRNAAGISGNMETSQSDRFMGKSEQVAERGELAYSHKSSQQTEEDQHEEVDVQHTYEEEEDNKIRNRISMENRNQEAFEWKEWPIYYDRPVDYMEACDILCMAISIDEKRVCKSVPQDFKGEGTFVVNISDLKNRHDVHQDGLGSWGKPTGRVRYLASDAKRGLVRCDDGKGHILPGTQYEWKCMLKRYEHPITASIQEGMNRFIKKIYTALYPPDRKMAVGLAVVTYEWLGVPFNFPVLSSIVRTRKPHGPPFPDGVSSWEAASFNSTEKEPLPATIGGFFGDSPLYAVGAVDFNTAASIILGGIIVEPSKICTSVPQGYRDSGTFVVDITDFESDICLRRDNNGGWGKPSGHSRYYKMDPRTGDAIRVDHANRIICGELYDIQILSKRYEHPAVQGRFVRKIFTGKSENGDRYYPTCSNLAVISYFWKGEPEWFEAGRQNQVHCPPARPTRRFREEYEEYNDFHNEEQPPDINAKRSRLASNERRDLANDDNMGDLQLEAAKKELDNQVRFSTLLDRLGTLVGRLEQSLPFVQEQRQPWIEHAGETVQEVIEEHEVFDETNYIDP